MKGEKEREREREEKSSMISQFEKSMLSRCEARKKKYFSFISRDFYFEHRKSERAPSNIVATLRDLTTLSLLFLPNEATIKALGATQTVTRITTGIQKHNQSNFQV